jgi:hypothetical protein
MDKPRKDVKFLAKLPPDVHDWLKIATAERSDIHMTMNRLLIEALRYYMTRPEDALDDNHRRICCGTDGTTHPGTGVLRSGHRGTCRYSAMRNPDGREYKALQAMWQAEREAGSATR